MAAKKNILSLGLIFMGIICHAQTDSTSNTIKNIGKFKFIGFVDAYYSYDFNNTNRQERGILINGGSPFCSHSSQNQFAINNVLLGVRYNHTLFRASAILHTGTYVQKNYSNEPELLKHINEAIAGIRVVNNLWLEAGIFSSHIGVESAISKDNINLTRSLMAENTPYFESGAKITYTTNNGKWLLSGLVLNGWQTILAFQRPQKAFGTQIQFKPFGDKLLLNSSTYFGPAPIARNILDSTGGIIATDLSKGGDFLMRYFHNFYFTYQLTDNLLVAAAFDIGFQEKTITDKALNTWFNPTIYAKYKLSKLFGINARVEHYNDRNGIMIATSSPNNFQTTGCAVGVDYSPTEFVMLRVEGKFLAATDEVFFNQVQNKATNNTTFLTTSIAVSIP